MTAAMVTSTELDRQAGPIGVVRKAKAYLALTKPRVIELLLVTTAPVMVLAANGIPNLWLVLGDARRRDARAPDPRTRSTATSTATSTA